jgi:hypothetical protein
MIIAQALPHYQSPQAKLEAKISRLSKSRDHGLFESDKEPSPWQGYLGLGIFHRVYSLSLEPLTIFRHKFKI